MASCCENSSHDQALVLKCVKTEDSVSLMLCYDSQWPNLTQ